MTAYPFVESFAPCIPFFPFSHRLVTDRNGAEGKKGRSNELLVAIRRVWMSVPVQSHLVVEQ